MFTIATETIRGVPTQVWAEAPGTLLDVWEIAASHGDAPFLVYEDEVTTFAEAHRRVDAIAAGLAARFGVQPGDRVAIAGRNYPEWALSFWAVVRLGAVAVPLNAWWTGPELAYAVGHSGATVVLADEERLERLAPEVGDLDRLAGVVALRSASTEAGAVGLSEVEAAGDVALPRPDVRPEDDATILYTSGTTGRPKGAVGTHRNATHFLWNGVYMRAMAAEAAGVDLTGAPPPSTLLTFPLFHVGGLQSHLLPYTLSGGKLVLLYRWDADLAIDLIEREQITAFSGVPTTAFELLQRARERGADLSTLAGISSGATLVPPELVRQIDDQFAHRVSPGNGYGLTETSGAMIFNAGPDYVAHPDSVGRPISPVNEVRVVRPDGSDAGVGEPGEIWLKGPTVVRGYFQDPDATAAAFSDGWFHTGDVGTLDEHGMLRVVDRLKDVVIRGGENVYSAEVEGVLFEHPDVVDAAIVGLPHPSLGEEVAAAVRLRPGAGTDVDALREHVAGRLAAFKVPSRWWVGTDDLPRNATGKVLKRQLRDSFPTDDPEMTP